MNSLEQAKAHIRSTLGLNNVPSSWTYEQRVAYSSALAVYIQNNPDSFPQDIITIANKVSNSNNTPLSDDSIFDNILDFGSAVGDNFIAAGEKVASIGDGVLTFAGFGKWLVPTVGFILVGLLIWVAYRKAKAA